MYLPILHGIIAITNFWPKFGLTFSATGANFCSRGSGKFAKIRRICCPRYGALPRFPLRLPGSPTVGLTMRYTFSIPSLYATSCSIPHYSMLHRACAQIAPAESYEYDMIRYDRKVTV